VHRGGYRVLRVATECVEVVLECLEAFRDRYRVFGGG